MSDAMRLDPLPGGRACTTCGAPLRPSHTAYAGGGRTVLVFRCSGCGIQYRGAERDAAATEERHAREARERRERREARPGAGAGAAGRASASGPARRPLDEGAPQNPVIDEETARQLRDLLGE